MKSDPHQTWHSDRGPQARSCTPKTEQSGLRCIVLLLGGAENFGEPDPLNLKPPSLCNPFIKSIQILTAKAS